MSIPPESSGKTSLSSISLRAVFAGESVLMNVPTNPSKKGRSYVVRVSLNHQTIVEHPLLGQIQMSHVVAQ